MADEPQVAAGEGDLTGFEGYSTAALERIRANLERGMVDAHRHMEAGTLNDRPKPGSATPREAGYTIDVLARQIDRVLKTRKERAGIMTEIVKGLWYPQGPPALEGESNIEYTNRLLGAGPRGQEGRPYDHRRNRQCSIGYHQECSDKLHLGVTMPDAGCGCPCHIERLHA